MNALINYTPTVLEVETCIAMVAYAAGENIVEAVVDTVINTLTDQKIIAAAKNVFSFIAEQGLNLIKRIDSLTNLPAANAEEIACPDEAAKKAAEAVEAEKRATAAASAAEEKRRKLIAASSQNVANMFAQTHLRNAENNYQNVLRNNQIAQNLGFANPMLDNANRVLAERDLFWARQNAGRLF